MSWQGDMAKIAATALIDGFDEAASNHVASPGKTKGAGYESVLLRSGGVSVGGLEADETLSELLLTESHLILDICVSKGLFKREHRFDYLPLGEVMCDDDVPCASAQKKFLTGWQLEVEFKYSTLVFTFATNAEAKSKRWAACICKEVSRIREESIERKRAKSRRNESRDAVVPAPQGAAAPDDEPSEDNPACGTGDAPVAPRARARIVVVRCQACHAPLSGAQGSTVTCAYCDTRQTIA